ncbi:MAG: transporter associated domain-containing protein, partial [Pseudomonadota bacterium]
RPLAVWLCLLPFRFPPREQLFIAWVGLRGAVPIILALFPLLAGVPEAHTVLDVAFFVVLISLTLQGWSIPYLARWLRLEVPPAPAPDARFDLGEGRHHAFLGYRLTPQAQMIDRPASALHLPGEARLVAVLRGEAALTPEAAGRLAAGDTLYVLARQADTAALGELLATPAAPDYLEKRLFYGDFTVDGSADMASVAELYGLPLPEGAAQMSLADFLAARLNGVPVAGDRYRLGNLEFVVREVEGQRITRIGLRIPTHLQ